MAVVDLTKHGSMSPRVAVQIMQSIVDRLIIQVESVTGPPLHLDPLVCPTKNINQIIFNSTIM